MLPRRFSFSKTPHSAADFAICFFEVMRVFARVYSVLTLVLTLTAAALFVRAGFLRVAAVNGEKIHFSTVSLEASGETEEEPNGLPDGLVQSEKNVSVPVLMYHQFSEKEERYSQWCMSPSELRADLEYLRENGYTTILPSELVAALNGEQELPEKPVILTFDDGHETMYTTVLPLLEEYDMKAVANVVGSSCDLYSGQEDHTLDYSCLTWDEVGALHASGRVEIGNHSYDLHDNTARKGIRILPGEDVESYREMLTQDTFLCQQKIEAATGVRPTVYAYPFGYCCEEAVEVLTGMGYTVLLGCQGKTGVLSAESTLPLALERFNRPHGISTVEFMQSWKTDAGKNAS